jgi:uncharacterized protein YgiB involved in biofilm formation
MRLLTVKASVKFVVASLAIFYSVSAMADPARGVANYKKLMSGQIKLEQLSLEERNEVLDVFRAIKRTQGAPNSSNECRNAWSQAQSAAQELEYQSRRLMRCAENRDFDDDCYTESRRARNAQDDYSSAVNSVKSYCS